MNIVESSIKYYPSLPYRRFNLRLLFGWRLFYHKDAWNCDIELYKTGRIVNLWHWRRYNTLCGVASVCNLFGCFIKLPIKRSRE